MVLLPIITSSIKTPISKAKKPKTVKPFFRKMWKQITAISNQKQSTRKRKNPRKYFLKPVLCIMFHPMVNIIPYII